MKIRYWGGWLFAALILLFSVRVQAQGPSPNVQMHLKYGFNNTIRNGSCVPLRVTLENSGEAFEGELEVVVPVQADFFNLSSNLWIGDTEWGNDRDRVYHYRRTVTLKAREIKEELFYLELPYDGNLTVRLLRGNQVITGQTLAYDSGENSSRVLVGVISQEQGGQALEGLETLNGMQIPLQSSFGTASFVKVIQLKPEELYPNADAISQLDVLIVDEGTEFTTEQKNALAQWKSGGGFYLSHQEGEDLSLLFQSFLASESEAFQSYLNQTEGYLIGDEAGLGQIPVRKRPSMGKYLLLLSLYIVIAGPGLYLLLKQLKRQKLLWLSICAVSLLFVGVIWILGRSTNLSAPFLTYSGLYEQQGTVWSETINLNFQAPYNNPYHLYLDSSYGLRPLNIGFGGSQEESDATAEQITLRLGEDHNKVTVENAVAFGQNYFKLQRTKKQGSQEEIRFTLSGSEEALSGSWSNPTAYDIRNAVLVMQNRVAVLGSLPAGAKGRLENCHLYSNGNDGLEFLLKDQMDFDGFSFPEYEAEHLASQIRRVLRSKSPDQVYLLGIVENPDLSFQENSGYQIYGSTLIQMNVKVDWTARNYRYYPNLEAYGSSGEIGFSSETNLFYGREITVEYPLGDIDSLEELTFFHADYDDEKYFVPFQGNVALYCWETGNFEEIQDWETTLDASLTERYLSAGRSIRVRYLLSDLLNNTDRSCMLPCIRAVGKVN